ncbi:MAG: outer membrane beta-barrel protein [Bacteroidales bacterium]|nr:outer membrane beta-barrel protein [Bacteroidales bacterium]
MKKILSLFVAAVMSMGTMASAQDIALEGVAGMNIANVDVSGANSRIAFHLGARATYAFQSQSQGLYANAAALFSLKGTKVGDVTYNPFYLEIPVHMGYKYPIVNNVAVFGEVGPYFALGLFGKANGVNIFGDNGFKRFDVGLGIHGGFEFSQKVRVSIGYDFGLLDVAKTGSAKNRNLMISLGYKF